jgi:hypothetical protein
MNLRGRIPNQGLPNSGRPTSEPYIGDLRGKLAITDSQMVAWELFAETLRANRGRMQAFDAVTDEPFGPLEERLAARDAMQQAAAELFAVLDKVQQQTAIHVLPLCCLPYPDMSGSNKVHRRQKKAESGELVEELKRNATYYAAGPDKDAGDLLWRAAKALAQRC